MKRARKWRNIRIGRNLQEIFTGTLEEKWEKFYGIPSGNDYGFAEISCNRSFDRNFRSKAGKCQS